MNKRLLLVLVFSAVAVGLILVGGSSAPLGFDRASGHAPAITYIVNSTADETGTCTPTFCALRQAILAANASPGPDLITFNIPISDSGYNPSTGQWTITLSSPLPALSGDGTTINAQTQPPPLGFGLNSDSPEIYAIYYIILWALPSPYGMEITGSYNQIDGLVIQGAQNYGVYIHGTGAVNNQLMGNEIVNNTDDGVRIEDGASLNSVGTQSNGNLISGNGGDGVEIDGSAGSNMVVGNYIGTDASGVSAQANSGYGVRISNSISITVGMLGEGNGNLISGNTSGGVLITGGSSSGNRVTNNKIGTNAEGDEAIPNLDGVVITNAKNSFIEDNLIAGNTQDGLRIEGYLATGTNASGNEFGQDAHAEMQYGNGRFGLVLQGESSQSTFFENIINKNGYFGDYTHRGGVGILTASTSNTFHQNEIAYNASDGVYINASAGNLLDANSIYSNQYLGINNENGGNQELPPPVIKTYNVMGTFAGFEAEVCSGCYAQLYSDNNGEGRYFEETLTPSITGTVKYGGYPKGTAYTLIAIDSDGNTSEFSASPVDVYLSIDDALPDVIVNKAPGDADSPAGNTIVEFVANITGYDPTLNTNLTLSLQIAGIDLGSPTRVFYRDQITSLDGTEITGWTNPSTGKFVVSGIDLSAIYDSSTGKTKWSHRIVFRFEIPHSSMLGATLAIASLSTSGERTLRQGVDLATLRLIKAEGIILTNRTLLYQNNYRDNNDDDVTKLLQTVYTLAQGSPSNSNPKMVVYYVDAYSSDALNWDNTTVDYSQSESTINQAADAIKKLDDDWIEDSTSKWVSGTNSCKSAVNNPTWLVILGDDDVIPFYRRPDPKGDEDDDSDGWSSDSVVKALESNGYMFTNDSYADFSLNNCGDETDWGKGFVDLNTGRIVGVSAADMLKLISNGLSGPAVTGRTVASSSDGFNVEKIVGSMTARGFNVLNDDESPSTENNSDWNYSDIVTILGDSAGFSAYAHQGHANHNIWGTGEEEVYLTASTFNSAPIAAEITANRPFFTACGCRSGLALSKYWSDSVVYGLVHAGASGVVGSTALMMFDPYYPSPGLDNHDWGEELVQDFWKYELWGNPSYVSVGYALLLSKRYYNWGTYFSSWDNKAIMEYALYGLPWVGFYGSVTNSPLVQLIGFQQDEATWPLVQPEATLADTYVVTYTLDASDYAITTTQGFNLVLVDGMEASEGENGPIVPLATLNLNLPVGASIVKVAVTRWGEVDLGALNIPMMLPAGPTPSGNLGGYIETPASVGIYPSQPYTVSVVLEATGQLVRILVIPLEYNAATHQTTLYSNVTVQVTYELSAKVGLTTLAVDTSDLAPGGPFTLNAGLFNASSETVDLTGTLTLENDFGEIVGVQALPPLYVMGGAQYPLAQGWVAPLTEGSYNLYLELWHAGSLQVIGRQTLSVTGGRITAFEVPDQPFPGQVVELTVGFSNQRDTQFDGKVTVSIYSIDGELVETLESSISLPAYNEVMLGFDWDTAGLSPGAYSLTAMVNDMVETVTYGPLQKSINLAYQTVYLPVVSK